MKLVAQTSQFRVYDDVLSEKDFRALWHHIQLESYVTVHQDGWVKVWRIPDGMPLAASVAVLLEKPRRPAAAEGSVRPGEAYSHGSTRTHPTNTGLDRVFDTLVQHGDDFADLVGRRGVDYDARARSSTRREPRSPGTRTARSTPARLPSTRIPSGARSGAASC